MDRRTLEAIETHIFTLDDEILSEYRAGGYEADHLQPGDRVWLDGDLFLTAEEIDEEIFSTERSLRDFSWANEASMRERLEELREVLRRLKE